MNREPVIEVKVEFDQPGMKFETETGEVSMIPFYGTVKGKLFNGIVEPWGVDTQVKNQIGIRHMSARYMLTGIDSAGEKCHIYVENNGWLTDDRPSRTFRTNRSKPWRGSCSTWKPWTAVRLTLSIPMTSIFRMRSFAPW